MRNNHSLAGIHLDGNAGSVDHMVNVVPMVEEDGGENKELRTDMGAMHLGLGGASTKWLAKKQDLMESWRVATMPSSIAGWYAATALSDAGGRRRNDLPDVLPPPSPPPQRTPKSSGNCWICDGWSEIAFKWHGGSTGKIEIHLEIDGWAPTTLTHGSVTRHLPPGECRYFFTVDGVVSALISSFVAFFNL